jgi:hypothetical protein
MQPRPAAPFGLMAASCRQVEDKAPLLGATSWSACLAARPDLLRQLQQRDPRLRARAQREWAQEGELMQKERTGLAHIDA